MYLDLIDKGRVVFYDYNKKALDHWKETCPRKDGIDYLFVYTNLLEEQNLINYLEVNLKTLVNLSNIFCYEGTAAKYSLKQRLTAQNKLLNKFNALPCQTEVHLQLPTATKPIRLRSRLIGIEPGMCVIISRGTDQHWEMARELIREGQSIVVRLVNEGDPNATIFATTETHIDQLPYPKQILRKSLILPGLGQYHNHTNHQQKQILHHPHSVGSEKVSLLDSLWALHKRNRRAFVGYLGSQLCVLLYHRVI